jgi:hypothetical protein
MELTDHERALLLAVIERILPADQVPLVSHDTILTHVLTQLEPDAATLKTWLKGLHRESFAVFGSDFAEMHVGMRDELLDRLESRNCRTDWNLEPTEFFAKIIDLVAAAYHHLYPAPPSTPQV